MGRTLDNLRKAEYGLYGLASANGLGEYMTGRDMFGNELSEEQRERGLNEAFALLGGNAVGFGLRKAGPTLNLGQVNKSDIRQTPSEIIAKRTKGMDLREHSTPHKQISNKKMKQLENKIDNRTITKGEYEQYTWNKKFARKRKAGVTKFWDMEASRILKKESATRKWDTYQVKDILAGKTPKYDGKPIYGHHAYSASKYPHLAHKGEVIYPATHNEHFHGWHGSDWKKSLPGRPIKEINDF